MNRDMLKRVAGIMLMLVSIAFISLGWYAYFILRRGELQQIILGSLFFCGCALTGLVYASVREQEPKWFVLTLRQLSQPQHFLLAIATFLMAAGSLWVAISSGVRPLFRVISGIGFLAFLYAGVRYVLEVQKVRKVGVKK